MDNSITQKPSTSSLVLKMGLLFGVLTIINLFVEYYSGQLEQGKSWMGFVFLIIEGVFAVVFIKKFRNGQLGGYITFGNAFGITLKSALASAIISVPFNFIFMHILHPEVMENMLKITEAKMVSNGTPDDQIELAMKIPTYLLSHPALAIAIQIFSSIITGTILGLIVAAICKKEGAELAAD